MSAGKSNASSAVRRLPNREAALDSLYDDLLREHVSVLGKLDRRRP